MGCSEFRVEESNKSNNQIKKRKKIKFSINFKNEF